MGTSELELEKPAGSWAAPKMEVAHIDFVTSDDPQQLPIMTEPPSTAAPSSKLGFAFEMAFPMSARTSD